jgi:histidinol phosphatase-like PHP family hydrolase
MPRVKSKRVRKVTKEDSALPITNREIAELLALQGEEAEGYTRKAFFRAAHAAFVWPEEAATLVAQDRSLTELPAIGPFISKLLRTWIEDPPENIRPAVDVRRDFLSLADANRILPEHPDWRERLQGDLQMHSEWSDGSGTIMEMARAGIERNYSYISITDHTKGLKIAGGINEKELEEQGAEIAAVNEQLKAEGKRFRVLRSTEMNLSPSGQGDMDSEALAKLDIVLGSFHSQLRKTEDQTERYLRAIENPDIQILGHPRGRVYNYRLGLKADWKRVFARAAELDKAVEIDAYSDRQDLNVELLQVAREEGVRISFGSDAHHPWQLIFLDLALAASLLTRIPAERVVNFMSAEDLLNWVQRVRGKK